MSRQLACQWMLQMPYQKMDFLFLNWALMCFFCCCCLFVCFLDRVSQSIRSALLLSVHFQMGTFESAILTKYISFHEHCTLLLHSACSNKTVKLLTVSMVSVKRQGLYVGEKGGCVSSKMPKHNHQLKGQFLLID